MACYLYICAIKVRKEEIRKKDITMPWIYSPLERKMIKKMILIYLVFIY